MAELGNGYGDETDVVPIEFRLTRKAELHEGHEVIVILLQLCRTRKPELRDGEEAGVYFLKSKLWENFMSAKNLVGLYI